MSLKHAIIGGERKGRRMVELSETMKHNIRIKFMNVWYTFTGVTILLLTIYLGAPFLHMMLPHQHIPQIQFQLLQIHQQLCLDHKKTGGREGADIIMRY